ncbi:phosphatidylinositol N-acetylglucosaminyltransferase subunit Q isoform X2 [Macrosteles quadrilineatus]|uniref:phosphatidylinositol N-acetylglucosaminyltransferase subunit Q isoform X2 n=1 Tax=Macrosteles quadrilineatus TaxID=74068 RepID=UPI0023E166E2|nr:phosphatidylinositol N-acetylglucosaminyltransferase subunit Q isoform X2 [Macrosteles quadrilineatus]
MPTNSYSGYPVVLFYPSNAVCDHGFLCGEVIRDDLFKTKNFFIHEVVDTSSVPEDAIGIVGNISQKKTKNKKSDWIRLKSFEKLPVLEEVICNNVNVERENCQVVLISLKDMVRYLMGSPADLKLNGPLNNVLGKFFLFHVDLWWAFLGYSRPLLELGLQAFVCLGCLGLSFQIAILADLLAIASFHVYIIYVYAARLYRAQLTGLVSLSRVFLGRKRNPVPGRVDSCPYTTEQLLIGTISFTVLLFLLPTTLVYYVVFTAIRLVLIAAGGVLTEARFILSCLPLYSTLLWLFNSPATTRSVRLSPKIVRGSEFVLVASPTQDSWWETVKACRSDIVTPPSPLPWGSLLWHLATGRLVYPV